jgi:hypothetical protein
LFIWQASAAAKKEAREHGLDHGNGRCGDAQATGLGTGLCQERSKPNAGEESPLEQPKPSEAFGALGGRLKKEGELNSEVVKGQEHVA